MLLVMNNPEQIQFLFKEIKIVSVWSIYLDGICSRIFVNAYRDLAGSVFATVFLPHLESSFRIPPVLSKLEKDKQAWVYH